MKSNIDYQCLQIFKELKFSKIYRFLIYKVDGERVVSAILDRFWIKLEPENKIGLTLYNLFLKSNPECLFSTWNTLITTP